MNPNENNRREKVEEQLVERWSAYDQCVSMNQMKAACEYRRDICLYLALLLNTYLEDDSAVDWRGIWADRLLDEEITSGLSGSRAASGLMVFGQLGVSSMHITPFYGSFVWSVNSTRPESYELCFAASGPWDQAGSPLVVPFTRDRNVRQGLLVHTARHEQERWATVYHGPAPLPDAS